MPTYKICFVGPADTGKTSCAQYLDTAYFSYENKHTVGVEVYIVHLDTNHGKITLEIWSTAGIPENRGLADGYYICSKGFVYFHAKDTNTRLDMYLPGKSFANSSEGSAPIIDVQWEDSIKTKVEKFGDTITPLIKRMTGHDDLVLL